MTDQPRPVPKPGGNRAIVTFGLGFGLGALVVCFVATVLLGWRNG